MAVLPLGLPINQISRVNDYVLNKFVVFLGAGANLYFSNDYVNYTLANTGYSGDPLSIVPYRPDKSDRVWAYIASSSLMSKINSDGTVYSMGIVPPITIPTAELIAPSYFHPDITFLGQPFAGAISTQIRVNPATASIGDIKYNVGTTGWAAIVPTGASSTNMAAGMIVTINHGGGSQEKVVVEEVHRLDAGPTNSISEIIYDVGSTGLCTIQPANIILGLDRNALVTINGVNVRVISVTQAADGSTSFTCNTGGVTNVSGQVITSPAFNIWGYTTLTHSIGENLYAFYESAPIIPPLGSQISVGIFSANHPGFGFSNINGRTWGPNDYLHFGVIVDLPSFLTEGKFIIDIDPSTGVTYAATDGNQNSYSYVFRPSDFQSVVNESQTSTAASTTAIQNNNQQQTVEQIVTQMLGYDVPIVTSLNGIVNYPVGIVTAGGVNVYGDNFFGNPGFRFFLPIPNLGFSDQLILGNAQFTEITIPLSAMTRIGSGFTEDLSTITALQFRFLTSHPCTPGVSDIWIGGTYGADNYGGLTPFSYRFRYRNSSTGAKSLPGPANRTGLNARRQGVQITGVSSTDPQVDKIDWERFGGSNLEWHYIGTSDNSSLHSWTARLPVRCWLTLD